MPSQSLRIMLNSLVNRKEALHQVSDLQPGHGAEQLLHFVPGPVHAQAGQEEQTEEHLVSQNFYDDKEKAELVLKYSQMKMYTSFNKPIQSMAPTFPNNI